MPDTHRFTAVLEHARGGGAVVLVPPDVATALGGLKQMRVFVRINEVDFKSSTYPYGGRGLFLGVHKAVRETAGVAFGQEATFEVRRDESPRVLDLAPELDEALAAEPDLRTRFDALSFSRRRELADPIAEAKKPETRSARLEKALTRLRELG